ncbi:MAG: AgmX/PglI C-terminal domain-containing protein [Pseudobdellovibrionaceae bacterium]|nr:AgmX/PglI C-terminal domain-containing protein [Bdellovibrionales bacterium]USN47786.1 MAG: AgmX/PglI C-terminal domain-containing protein [Pseudobdellovibrionaceae bacterium]
MGKVKLTVRLQDASGEIFCKEFSKLPILIGRDATCHVQLPDSDEFQLIHAMIKEQDGLLVVADNSGEGFLYMGDSKPFLPIHEKLVFSLGSVRIIIEDSFGERAAVDTFFGSKVSDLEKTKAFIPEEFFTNLKEGVVPTVQTVQNSSGGTESLSASANSGGDYGFRPMDVITNVRHYITKSFGIEKLRPKKKMPRRSKYDLLVSVVWRGVLYDSKVYRRGEEVDLRDRNSYKSVYLPNLKDEALHVNYVEKNAEIEVPTIFPGELKRGEEVFSVKDVATMATGETGHTVHVVKLILGDMFTIYLGDDMYLCFNYVPRYREFRLKFVPGEELNFNETATWSVALHTLFILMIAIFAPKIDAPQVEGVPQRYAKLLVPPKPKEIEKKKPPEKKVVKKIEKKKPIVKAEPIRKPKKVVVQKSQKIKQMNKFPLKLESKRVTKTPATVVGKAPEKITEVKNVGALGVLGTLGKTPTQTTTPVVINPSPNAGGLPNPSSKGVMGLLKSKGGKLAAGGTGQAVKTKGLGFGTGTGYGVQGKRGVAGSRQVAGQVIGSPKLMELKRTEGLTRKQVMDVVNKYVGEIQQCYEQALLSDPGLRGRVEYEWLITPGGQVKTIKVVSSEMRGGGSLNSCVFKVFKGMKFPKARNGQETVPRIGFPFGRL